MSPRSLFVVTLAATSINGAPLALEQRGAVDVTPTHTVRLDVIAANARGEIISTLTPGDFEVRENGRLVAIDEAQFVKDSPRLVAIYLDEYHISPGADADRAREALIDFVDTALDPRDRIAVMKPLDSLYTIRFTDNREDARGVIAGLEGRKDDYAPRTQYERSFMTGSDARIEVERTQVAISALNALSEQLGAVNALRKTLLVVSEGFEAPERRRGQEHLATLASVIRAANRANVSIYPVDPRTASATDRLANEAMLSLADETDGRATANARGPEDLGAAIRAAVGDANAYYLLTYRSAHREDGTFHPVEVRVTRARVQVRARSGYWAPSANDRLAAELLARPAGPSVISLGPPRRTSPLIQPWFGLSLGDDGKTRVTFVWEPAVAAPGALMRAAARLELTALGAEDAVLFQGAVLPTGPGMVEEKGSEPARAIFDVQPGTLRLRMKIQDAAREQVDSDVREISVRDLRGKISIGTPEFLRARNAREFRTLYNDPHAVPVSSRRFRRTERLLVRFPAYAPDGQALAVSARLLNLMGQPMRALDVRTVDDGEHEVDIVLSNLATGDYQLELDATGPSGKTTEVLGFRVTS